MKILSGSLILAGLLLALDNTSPPAQGCAGVTKKDKYLRIATESALIVWDDKSKTQHFIRRASFETQEPYFGFLVPTPTKPTLAEAPDELFQHLEDWTKPEVQTKTRYEPMIQIGCPGAAKSSKDKTSFVEVVESGSVANFNYKVLKATDSKALRDWLDEHGYDARPQLMDWVDGYLKQGWYITAFQIAKSDNEADTLSTKGIRMSLTTDRPFFPYREPAESDARVKAPDTPKQSRNRSGPPRLLRLFVIAGERMRGKLGAGTTPWPGKAAWANPLQEKQHHSLTDLLDPRKVPVSEGAWLTVFDDHSSPRPGSDDLFFSSSEDQSTLDRPPEIHIRTVVVPGPGEACCLLAILGPIALFIAVRRWKTGSGVWWLFGWVLLVVACVCWIWWSIR